jgi:hypothetical protein
VLLQSEVESFYSESMEIVKADCDAEKSKSKAIFRCLTVNCSVDDVVEVDGMHC